MTKKPLSRSSLEPVCPALAIVIRRRREACRWSLNRMAELTCLSRQMIGYVETQRSVPTIDTVARIGRAFGVSCSRLVGEAERRIRL